MKFQEILRTAEERLFIIGEAGVNHDGSVAQAKELVDMARECGCDAVKFQTWITEQVYSRTLSEKPEYQKRGTDSAESEYDTIKKLELSHDAFRQIKTHCDEQGILFISTPDEIDSANFLINELKAPFLKTASQDVTNTPFLRALAEKRLPILFSTGASTLSEVFAGVQTIQAIHKELIILHCLSSYPAPLEELNLNAIPKLRAIFNCHVGFSDHTLGPEAACAAVALGARVLEKHITLNRTGRGPDHQASADPAALKHYIRTTRAMLKALGDGDKRVMPSESANRAAFHRFMVAAKDIQRGEKLKHGDFLFKKVSTGIEPRYLDLLLGAKARVDIKKDSVIEWRHIIFG